MLTDVTGLTDTLGGFYFKEILWKEVNMLGIVLKSLSLTHAPEVVSLLQKKLSISCSCLNRDMKTDLLINNIWRHYICRMITGGLRSSTLSALPWSPGHHACSCRNSKHVIKVSELIRRVSPQLMRSCHVVFIGMRWACCEPRCLHHHFMQHARILWSCLYTYSAQVYTNCLQ